MYLVSVIWQDWVYLKGFKMINQQYLYKYSYEIYVLLVARHSQKQEIDTKIPGGCGLAWLGMPQISIKALN